MVCNIAEKIVTGQGNTETIEVEFLDGTTPIDITGWTILFGAKKGLSSVDFVIDKEVTVHTDPTAGLTAIELDTTDTAIAGDYIYELRVIQPNDEETVKLGLLQIYQTLYGSQS